MAFFHPDLPFSADWVAIPNCENTASFAPGGGVNASMSCGITLRIETSSRMAERESSEFDASELNMASSFSIGNSPSR